MASSTSSLWNHVARSCSSVHSRAASSSLTTARCTQKASGAAFAVHAPLFHRSFVMSALTRSALPRRLFPCDMLLARNASTAARVAHIPSSIYADDAEALDLEDAKDAKDPATHFHTMNDRLHPHTLKAITQHPFKHTHMSTVQARIFPLLPHLAEAHDAAAAQNTEDRPRDLLVKAKTGTGKTMAFLVPAIESRIKSIEAHVEQAKIDSGLGNWSKADAQRTAKAFASSSVGTLILSPTRELATQIAVEAQNLTTHHPSFQVQILLGGESRGAQIREWRRGRKDIVVATPGRLMDLLDSEPEFADALKSTRMLVLDEADTLLDMGFRDSIELISARLPPSPVRQTFLFSATVSKAIQGIAAKLLHPQHTFVNCVLESDSATHTHIPQYTTTLRSGADSFPYLIKLIAHDQLMCMKEGRKSKVIVFFSTTKMTQLFADMLVEATNTRGPSIFPFEGRTTRMYEMHAKRDMSKRIAVSKSFRADNSPSNASVLITSDVSARGVDYPGVTRVIQMGLPPSVEMYVHRIGRTGRGGDRGGQGRGDLVVMDWEAPWVPKMERETGGKISKISTDLLTQECKQLLEEVKGASKNITYGQANLEEIDSFAAELTRRMGSPAYDATPTSYPNAVGSDLISSTFTSQAGFYIGRASVLGLRTDAVLRGLQSFFQTMCGHSRPMNIPRKMMDMYSNGGADQGGYRKRGSSYGYTSAGSGAKDRYSGYESSSRYGSSGGYGATPSRGGSSGGYGATSSRGSRGGGAYAGSSSRSGGYGDSSGGSSSYGSSSSYGRQPSSSSRGGDYTSRSRGGGHGGVASSSRGDDYAGLFSSLSKGDGYAGSPSSSRYGPTASRGDDYEGSSSRSSGYDRSSTRRSSSRGTGDRFSTRSSNKSEQDW